MDFVILYKGDICISTNFLSTLFRIYLIEKVVRISQTIYLPNLYFERHFMPSSYIFFFYLRTG